MWSAISHERAGTESAPEATVVRWSREFFQQLHASLLPRMAYVTDTPEGQLRYLGSLDLYPGAEVEVVRKSPFEGPVSLQVNGSPQVISHSLAQRIRVRPEADGAGG